MTTYRSSDGREHVISDMPNGYLHSALNRLIADDRTGARQAEIDAMTAEVVRRAKSEDVTLLTDDQIVARYRTYEAAKWRGALDDAGVISRLMSEAERRDAERLRG